MNPQDLEQPAQQNTLSKNVSKNVSQKRLIGLAMVVICIGVTIFDWTQESSSSKFDVFIGFLSPFFTCLGLSILLYPNAKKYIPDKTPGSLLLGQKVLLGAGVVSGIFNWLLLNNVF
jgi:hypothetical protein